MICAPGQLRSLVKLRSFVSVPTGPSVLDSPVCIVHVAILSTLMLQTRQGWPDSQRQGEPSQSAAALAATAPEQVASGDELGANL